MKPFERILLIVFALLVIYSAIDLLNYRSWPKFYLGVALVVLALAVLFITFKSMFKKNQ